MCRSVLQCVAVCCSVLQRVDILKSQCIAVCCSVLQCVAVCYSVLQCVAVCRHSEKSASSGFDAVNVQPTAFGESIL